MTDLRKEADMIQLIYELYRHRPHVGKSSYLHDHYHRGVAGIMRPPSGARFADAAWRAGQDAAKAWGKGLP